MLDRLARRGVNISSCRACRQTINSIEQERYTPSLPLALALARSSKPPWEEMFDENHV
jgi:putative transcriptional regulator